jgi:hypothetical protein
VHLDNQVSFINALKEELKDELLNMVTAFASYVSELKGTIKQLSERINGLQTHLNYYKEKAANDCSTVPSVPLNEAIITVINDLVSSCQRYTLLFTSNLGSLVAEAVFHPYFVDGVALEYIVKRAKKWLRSNVFTPQEILKQMDIHGGTLNYQGISVLNDVETSAYKGECKRVRDRVLCTPSTLQ